YDVLVQKLVASGVISDPGMIYFDVRPSAHVPTIEMRVADACTSVDTVVLIAGLFRAVVARELARLREGAPSPTQPIAIERAAMWRAARSGLESELVDLSGPRSVPAGVLIRDIVRELRPELAAHGDYELVHDLCEEALARGSSACRQRDVLQRRDRITDVVDAVVAETRGERVEPRAPGSPSLWRGYESPSFDEGILPDARPRPSHAKVLESLSALGRAELGQRLEQLEREEIESGVVFRSVGQ